MFVHPRSQVAPRTLGTLARVAYAPPTPTRSATPPARAATPRQHDDPLARQLARVVASRVSEQLPAAVLQRKAKHGRRDRSGDVYSAMAKAGRSPEYIGLSKYFAKHVDSLPGFRAEMLMLLDDAKRDSDTGDGVNIRIPHRGTLWVDYGEWADLRRQLAKDDERYVGGETGFVKDEDDGKGISGMTAAEEQEALAEHLAYDSPRR